MKKTNALIAAVLVTSMLTSCGGTDTAEMTSAESTVSETTESEVTEATEAATVSETDTLSAESEETTTETSAEPVENVAETEETTAATGITGIQSVLSEDVYGLGSAKIMDESIGYSSLPENNIPYLLWESDNGDMSIYGVITNDEVINDYGDKEYVEIIVIRHDNMIETFECKWCGMAGRYPMEITALNESQNAILGTVVNETGTLTLVGGAVLFSQNSSGNYELFTTDNEAILSDIRDRVTITLDNEQDVVTFSADGVEYTTETASINSYLQRLMSDDSIKVDSDGILISDWHCVYSCDSDGKIICTTNYRVADEVVAAVDAELSFNNGKFTVEKIKKIYNL